MNTVRRKHGEICHETGLVFWGYNKNLSGNGQWMTAEKFNAAKLKQKDWERRQPKDSFRKSRNTGPKAATRRSDYDKRKRAEDPDGFRKKQAQRAKNRRNSDPLFALATLCRSRIRLFIIASGLRKTESSSTLIGCSWAALKVHLEQRFTAGMSWENRGAWHVDHVIPLASAVTDTDVLRLCHYTNLQPLWKLDNQRKGARIPAVPKS